MVGDTDGVLVGIMVLLDDGVGDPEMVLLLLLEQLFTKMAAIIVGS